jgi:hypothetical protein
MPEVDDIRTLLKDRLQEGNSLLGHYIKSFTVYLAVTAVLLKFALDTGVTAEMRYAMSIFGLAISILGVGVCALGEHLRRAVLADIRTLSAHLALPMLSSTLAPLRNTVVVATLFVASVIAGWIYLLL